MLLLLAPGAWSGLAWELPVAATCMELVTPLHILREERVLAERFVTQSQACCGLVARWF